MRGGAGMGQDKTRRGGDEDPILRPRPAPLPSLIGLLAPDALPISLRRPPPLRQTLPQQARQASSLPRLRVPGNDLKKLIDSHRKCADPSPGSEFPLPALQGRRSLPLPRRSPPRSQAPESTGRQGQGDSEDRRSWTRTRLHRSSEELYTRDRYSLVQGTGGSTRIHSLLRC
ncbi:hypothetical protein SO802_011948 [Lithocarpus litseifolius]|uniref:Uncharacterized protein n=1 Tax=Lithocarpus litseifolius TaxID=425828 RepID=A0AAW2D1E2_9ROSI